MDSVGLNGQSQSLFADFIEIKPFVVSGPDSRHRWLIYVKNGPNRWDMDTYISNLPAETKPSEFAELIGQIARRTEIQKRLGTRLKVRRFEGRSWRGFHHHLALWSMAAGFLNRQPEYAK